MLSLVDFAFVAQLSCWDRGFVRTWPRQGLYYRPSSIQYIWRSIVFGDFTSGSALLRRSSCRPCLVFQFSSKILEDSVRRPLNSKLFEWMGDRYLLWIMMTTVTDFLIISSEPFPNMSCCIQLIFFCNGKMVGHTIQTNHDPLHRLRVVGLGENWRFSVFNRDDPHSVCYIQTMQLDHPQQRRGRIYTPLSKSAALISRESLST